MKKVRPGFQTLIILLEGLFLLYCKVKENSAFPRFGKYDGKAHFTREFR